MRAFVGNAQAGLVLGLSSDCAPLHTTCWYENYNSAKDIITQVHIERLSSGRTAQAAADLLISKNSNVSRITLWT